MNAFEIIHEMDDEETGKPTCWSAEVKNPENREELGRFIWIMKRGKQKFTVEYLKGRDFVELKKFAGLKPAMAWAETLI